MINLFSPKSYDVLSTNESYDVLGFQLSKQFKEIKATGKIPKFPGTLDFEFFGLHSFFLSLWFQLCIHDVGIKPNYANPKEIPQFHETLVHTEIPKLGKP